jgi:hypothetical protein
MMYCGHRDRRGIELQVSCQQFADRGKDWKIELGSGFCRAGRVRFNCPDERNAEPGRLQLAIHAEMVTPEGSRACNGHT